MRYDDYANKLFDAKCIELGYIVSSPYISSSYDKVVDVLGNKMYKVQVLSTNSHHISFNTTEKPQVDFFAILFKKKMGWFIIPNIHLNSVVRLRFGRILRPKQYSIFLSNWNFNSM